MPQTTRMKAIQCLFLCLTIALFSSCDDNEYSDNNPPDGQGGIIVVNNRAEGMHVFIDGEAQADVGDFDDRAYNVTPGAHRIILDARRSRGAFIDEVEVLAGRNVVLLAEDAGDNALSVRVQLD